MGKRKIKLLMLGLMDRIEQINAILVEKKCRITRLPSIP